jgi:hypothetical protein
MANVFFAAVLLSGILAVSGCAGPLNGIGALASALGSIPSYGGGQAYPYAPGVAGGYAQPVQPYYQPQPYAYSGPTEVYPYQPGQPVPQVTGEYASPSSGHWARRQQRQEERMQQGLASGQLTPQEARRLQHEQRRIQGAEGRMRADGNLSPRERTRLNTMQQRSSQDIYRLRHNGVQAGPTAPPTAQVGPAAQPRMAAPSRAAAPQRAAAQPRASRPNGNAP